jgi:ABC-2 type transport system ATP-binding protein
MSFALEVENLKVRYRNRKGSWIEAVKGLSFAIQPGEVVGFLGPNGAGKSSTLKAVMGFVEPSSGHCHVFDLEAGSLPAKGCIGYLPEVAMYYPFLTPLETLTLYGELQGLKGAQLKKEALHLLEIVGLSETIKKQNRQLSKGMLQRVGIAQALLGSPKLLVLDEVTSGLDPVGRRELRALLKDRQNQGSTLFFSSHELSEVELICDRILLIDKGELIQEREMSSLKEELRKYSLTYAGAVAMVGLSEDWTELEAGIFRAEFHNKKALLTAIERVQDKKGHILDVESSEGSLEDYFVSTIERAA